MLGSLGAAFALCNTLSFLVTTPGLDPQGADMGFLLKDVTLLGAALWSAAEASAAARGWTMAVRSVTGEPVAASVD